MRIINASVYGANHEFEKQNITINGQRIDSIGSDKAYSGKEIIIDAKNLYVIPGLIDIHIHGAMGQDFSRVGKGAIDKVLEYEYLNGVLEILPTIMSLEYEEMLTKADSFSSEGRMFRFEGPFLNKAKCGAQSSEVLKNADSVFIDNLLKKYPKIKIMDIAPEISNALEVIRKYSDRILFSLGHTDADYETSIEAIEAGAKLLTHAYNAMNGINHRKGGPLIAFHEKKKPIELISDGIHIAPHMVKFTFDSFGSDNIVLISDSTEATGLGDGKYKLGNQNVVKRGNRIVLDDDSNVIAGSATNLFQCMTNAVSYGVKMEDAIRSASENPARILGIDDEYGYIKEGYFANLVIIDKEFCIKHVIRKGQLIV